MNVVIYSKENCSYCSKAKMLLTNRNIHYTELKLNEDFTRETLNDLYPSATSFPVIVVDGFNIGGYNELNNMLTEEIQKSQKLLME